jgi:hypothetical protein
MYLPHTDDEATVIDTGPHWSARPLTTLPRPVQRSSAHPPLASVRPARLVQDPVPGPYMLPRTFYSFAEERSAAALDTECVAPLPMSEIRPDWQIWLAATWARFAVPLCGAAAGLILIISYLALGGETRGVAAAATTTSTSAIVMRVDGPAPTNRDAAVRNAIAMARSGAAVPTETAMVDIEEAATTGTIVAAAPDEIEMDAVPMQRPAKHVVKHAKRAKPSASKRGPIKLNASTALGDLRVSRSR